MSAVAAAAIEGLSAHPKRLPPKLFYDAEGVRLFNLITEQPEYLLTRTERSLLRAHGAEMASTAVPGSRLVEYGASDESKALLLLERAPAGRFLAYLPIDIQPASLAAIVARLSSTWPALAVVPVAGDFMEELALPAEPAGPGFGFFPGSTIGNFEPEQTIAFLSGARRALGPDARFLVGTDLVRPEQELLAAYDDRAGITAAFNLNLLARLNREAEADFDIASFRHDVRWNARESRIEMHLAATRAQQVRVAGRVIRFAAGETIHTENSYKFAVAGFAASAQAAGWDVEKIWTDAAAGFAVHLLALPR